MKYIFVFLMIFLVFPAHAQTPVPKEKANQYFENCVKQPPSQTFSASGQQTLCACTAARLTQFFTIEEMTDMANKDPVIARPAFNNMMVNVYAPCMEEPTREYHYNSCVNDPQTKKLGLPSSLCRCSADALAVHMKDNGAMLFKNLLARDPMNQDPMSAIFNDPEFQEVAKSKLMGCVTR